MASNEIQPVIKDYEEWRESLKDGGEFTERDSVMAIAFAMSFYNYITSKEG